MALAQSLSWHCAALFCLSLVLPATSLHSTNAHHASAIITDQGIIRRTHAKHAEVDGNTGISEKKHKVRKGPRRSKRRTHAAHVRRLDQNLVAMNPAARKETLWKALESVELALNRSEALKSSLSPHFPHEGKSKAIPVKYEVRNGSLGIGIFLSEPVIKGQTTWVFLPEQHVEIYKSDIPLLTSLLQASSGDVQKWFMRWSYEWRNYCDCMLIEMDDGRFTNDANGQEANQESSSRGFSLVAAKDLEAGTELLEDYEDDELLELKTWWQPLWDTYNAGDDAYMDA